MIKKTISLISGLLCLAAVSAVAQPKYVFFFIGDGMGTNQIQLTEMYRAGVEGELGIKPLTFTQFPVATFATHYSANSDVTDSAASGTALATGVKTTNGRLGTAPDGSRIPNIAEMAKSQGKKVAILTTVEANHATPGAFEAHQDNRKKFYEIAEDMLDNGFDFYGGRALTNETKRYDGTQAEPLRPRFEQAGYTICGPNSYEQASQGAHKILMLPDEGTAVTLRIDANAADEEHRPNHILLKDMTRCALDFVMRDNKKGFFMMVEGGEIDHACHSHDAASTIQEVIDFDEAIQVALEFYHKHPKQTLILVTADHETGGLTIGPKDASKIAQLQYQKESFGTISQKLNDTIQAAGGKISWAQTKDFLSEHFGLFREVKVGWDDEKVLRDIYENSIAQSKVDNVKDLYSSNSRLVSKAGEILYRLSGVNWVGSHSAGYVPVFAIGQGSEVFTHKTDNAEIGRDMIRVSGYKK